MYLANSKDIVVCCPMVADMRRCRCLWYNGIIVYGVDSEMSVLCCPSLAYIVFNALFLQDFIIPYIGLTTGLEVLYKISTFAHKFSTAFRQLHINKIFTEYIVRWACFIDTASGNKGQ
ncbi:hypothetical protein LOAG_13258 [Loa loa]|uniref:Uncharacterized protein n=1 Tax=Loa loa TaxID=7209 RepID=A0A1S0TK79_LOALO|nr:hypothetical protein LOAG_13258 [Loa loa]EFO15254.1 hypothetical protein LOAG_13258 [Loa loa]